MGTNKHFVLWPVFCFSLGVVVAALGKDIYPFPPDSDPGGAKCGLDAGCMGESGYNACTRCCEANCPDSNDCFNACWNVFCRFGGGAGCPQ